MTFRSLHQQFNVTLEQIYPAGEAQNITRWVWESITNMRSGDMAVKQNETVPDDLLKKMQYVLEELMTHKPVQYVLGEAWFYGLRFHVNEAVLIPRPETEELVEWVISEYKKQHRSAYDILDIGTGSGCIAISIKHKIPDAEVTAIDISEAALQVARKNAEEHSLDIDWKKISALDASAMETLGNFDIIISNPPYIPERDKADMHKNVLEYEPAVALFAPDNDPLIFYRHIAQFAKKHLKPNGRLYFEIHENLGASALTLLRNERYDAILKKDAQGKDRMLKCSLLHGSDRIST